MVIMASSPILTALLGYLVFGEKLTLFSLLGMFITIIGIALVIFVRESKTIDTQRIQKLSTRGILYAFIGAFGQATGFITSKLGMGDYSPFAATQIRLFAGFTGFLILYAIGNRWIEARNALKDKRAMTFIMIGAFFGPFLGVSFSLMSLQFTKAAIASTIMALLPVLIIPFSIFLFKEKVSVREIFGAAITVAGVAVMVLLQ
jgi:drug/metabolite transporter (DMT)-like permease